MAETTPASSSQQALQEKPSPAVNLQVVSPSVGVGRPLSFPDLPPSTTIHQLKDKIRSTLPVKPAGDQQRLIHRGRLLARDSETLQEVFGTETIQSGDLQTLHLVLRDSSDLHTPSQQTPFPRGRSPAAPGSLPAHPTESQPAPHPQAAQARLTRVTPAQGFPNAQVPIPDLARPTLASQLQMMQHQHEVMVHQTTVQWMNQLQREAGYRQLLNQQLRERAAFGLHGAQDNNAQQLPGSADNLSGRNSPAIGQSVHNVTREVTGPNGQYWRIAMSDTVAGPRTSSPQPGQHPPGRGPLSPAEVHQLLRGADASQATRAMTNAMHRSASGASLANMANMNTPIQAIPPGVTTPLFPNGSRHASRTATPDLPLPTTNPGNTSAPAASQNNRQTQSLQGHPEVYILSSPSGPRALVINGSTDAYFTPMVRLPPSIIPSRQPFQQHLPWVPQIYPPPNQTQPQEQQNPLQVQEPQPQGQNDGEARVAGAQHAAPGVAPIQPHPHNPGAGAGALVAVAWPHIWLIVRLTAFVWVFTASDTSWSRWFAVVSIAFAVFAINTGFLNGVVAQALDPFRRHLEGLIPFADPAGAGGARGPDPTPERTNDPAEPAATAGREPELEPEPAAAAVRLVARHRNNNADWLLNQVRRLERAGLLFLASITPGVAERHIANLEAQERAERQRREAEEAAQRETAEREAEAATAAAAAAAAAAADDGAAEDGGNGAERVGQGARTSDSATERLRDETGGVVAARESLL